MKKQESKTVSELVKLLEPKLDSSKITNIRYSEQDFHYQKESKLFEQKKSEERKKE